MILTVDIGNTNINFAVFNKGKMLFGFKSATKKNLFKFDLLNFKKNLNKRGISQKQIENVIICSVVPKSTKILKSSLSHLFNIKPLICGENIKVPIKNLYKNPGQVGQDRLVAAFAAAKLYGMPIIVVDFGTATTFDVVSRKGASLGGIIFPGIGISLEALHEKTALLPKVRLKKPPKVIAKDTAGSILSGIFYGFAGLVDSLIERIFQQLNLRPSVVFTGGFAEIMSKYCKAKHRIDSNLILKGLQHICLQHVTE